MGGISGYPALPFAGRPLKAYQRFLFWAAGAGRDFLRDCVEAEKFKYECIGALICLTATVASVSMFMAVWLTSAQDLRGSMLALPVALLWGILIFTIDRFMVSSLRTDAVWWFRLWQSLPRLVLAVIIGIIISRPVEIKIFETEIKKVIGSEIARNLEALGGQIEDAELRIGDLAAQPFQERKSALAGEIQRLRKNEQQLSASLSGLRADLAYWQREAEGERDGTAGSGRRGEGPRYREKLQRIAEYERRVQETEAELKRLLNRLPEAEKELRALGQAIDDKREALSPEISVQRDALLAMQRDAADIGFLELNLALHRLAKLPQFMPAAAAEGSGLRSMDDQREVETIVSATLWGITLLFITIEVLPILTKLMAPTGQYDEKMQSAPYAAQMLSMQELVAVARARTAFLEKYEYANGAFYTDAFERLKGDDSRIDTVVEALWEHLRGGLRETLTRLRGVPSPCAPDRAEPAEPGGPTARPAPPPGAPAKPRSRLGGRVLVSVATTTLMFLISFFFLLNQQEVTSQEAIETAATISGGLALPLLTLLLHRSGPDE